MAKENVRNHKPFDLLLATNRFNEIIFNELLSTVLLNLQKNYLIILYLLRNYEIINKNKVITIKLYTQDKVVLSQQL